MARVYKTFWICLENSQQGVTATEKKLNDLAAQGYILDKMETFGNSHRNLLVTMSKNSEYEDG